MRPVVRLLLGGALAATVLLPAPALALDGRAWRETPPAPAAPAAPAAEASKPEASAGSGVPVEGLRLLIGALVIAALLYAAPRVLRRLPVGQLLPSADGAIRITARTHLGAKEKLCLVEVGATTILIGMTPQGFTLLHVWPEQTVDAAPRPTPTSGGPGGAPESIPGQLRALAARIAGRR